MKYFAFKCSCVYAIVNLMNGKRYIGSTVHYQHRMQMHRTQLRNGTHDNRHLLAAWKKYGEDAFVFGIIEEVSIEQMFVREQAWLNLAQPNAYNVSKVARSAALGLKRSPETRERMRHAANARVASGTNTFDNLTAEQRQRRADAVPRVSASNRGRKRSKETLERLRAAWVTRPRRPRCKNGHEMAGDNLYLHGGTRHCAACRAVVRARWNRRVSAMKKALELINSRPHAA